MKFKDLIETDTIATKTKCDICKKSFTGKDMKYNVIDPYIEAVSGKKVKKNICKECYKKRMWES